MPDEAIDYSEIPPLPDELWERAVRNPLYRPAQIATAVQVGSDVRAWLKSTGEGYQTRLNATLREAMLRDAGGD
jgi:uncharacterized protein (DUF4415 family)